MTRVEGGPEDQQEADKAKEVMGCMSSAARQAGPSVF